MAFLKIVSSVRAAESEDAKRKLVKPTELDVYWVPPCNPIVDTPQKPSTLLIQVSHVRKYFWQFSGQFSSIYGNTKQKVSTVKEKVDDMYATAAKDPITLIRPGCIATAFIVGALLPGRGRKKFLRLVSATASCTVVAAVSYPKPASLVAINAFNKGKDGVSSLVEFMKKKSEGSKSEQVMVVESSKEVEEIKFEEESSEVLALESDEKQNEVQMSKDATLEVLKEELIVDTSTTPEAQFSDDLQKEISGQLTTEKSGEESNSDVTNPPDETVMSTESADSENQYSEAMNEQQQPLDGKPDVDYGQSNPEDKDMYSTRQ